MGETIEFPDDYQRLIRAGKKALENRDHLEAVIELKKAAELQDTFEVNHLLVEALSMNNDFKSALELADQRFADYLESPDRFMEYFHLLLLNHQYLQARHYQVMVRKNRDFPQEIFQEALAELQQLEGIVELVDPESFYHKRDLLQKIDASGRPFSPGQWAELTEGLSFEGFQRLTGEFLPTVNNPFLRPRLVEELTQLGSEQLVTVKDLAGRPQQVKPNLLELPEKAPALETMIRYVEEQLGNRDPILAEGVISEIQAHYVLAFPFNPQDEAPLAWSRSYLVEYQEVLNGSLESDLLDPEIQQQKADYRKIYQRLT